LAYTVTEASSIFLMEMEKADHTPPLQPSLKAQKNWQQEKIGFICKILAVWRRNI
jgi:hypothetical protein